MINEARRGCFAVAPCDAYYFRIGVADTQLDLRNNRNALFSYLPNDGYGIGDARAFHHLVDLQYPLFRVPLLFKIDFILFQCLSVWFLQLTIIREEDIESLFLTEEGSTYATF